MKERLKILFFSMLATASLGIIDYLIGLYYSIYELRSEGLFVLLKSLAASQSWYVAAGTVFGFLMMAAVSVFLLLGRQAGRQFSFSGKMLALLSGAFVVLTIEAFTNIHTNWKLFLDFLFFIPVGVLAGVGMEYLWEKYLKNYLGGPVRGMFIIYLSLILSAGFSTFWTLKLSLSTSGKLTMILIAGLIFVCNAFLARACFAKKSAGLAFIYVILGLVILSLPGLGYRPKAVYKRLGAPKNKLNIILIIADACRADALSIYGGKNPTPHLDQLAREGVLFKNAYSQAPWTLPSMLSMLSSFYPSIFTSGQPYHAGGEVEFFPERLKGYGYYSESIISNYLLAGSSGILQGFDRTTAIHNRFRLQALLFHPVLARTYYLFRRFAGLTQLPDHTGMMTIDGQKTIKSAPRPFFLWLHYMNPHEPYNPPDRYLKQINYQGFLKPPFFYNDPFALPGDLSHPQEMEVKLGFIFFAKKDKDYIHDLYLAQLRYLDEKVGELAQTVKDSGLEKNTIIIFASDHGEEFWEHDNMGHGASLYDELLHVPLIIWGGGLKPRVVEEQVEMLDLVPSLADLLGMEPNPDWQGKSFGHALESGGTVSPRIIFAEGLQRPEEMKGIRTGNYKLVVGLLTRKMLLYNLKDDPLEQENVFADKPELAKDLFNQIMDWSAKNVLVRSKYHGRPMSPEQIKENEDRMRAAGYAK